MNITDLESQADKALNFLAETDLEHAELKAKQNLYSELRKAVIAAGFESAQGAAEVRRQAAHNTPEYHEHLKLMQENDVAYIYMDNRRKRAIATIDLYRTESANQRRG